MAILIYLILVIWTYALVCYHSIKKSSLRKIISSCNIDNLWKKSQIWRLLILTKCRLSLLLIIILIVEKEFNSNILLCVILYIFKVDNSLKNLSLNEIIFLSYVLLKHSVYSTIFNKSVIFWIKKTKNIAVILNSLRKYWICQIC